MEAIKTTNLGLRFLLELCMLAALGYWGFQVSKGTLMKIGLGIGAPLIAAVLWGLFEAPNSSMRLQGAPQLILEVAIFAVAAAALYAAKHPSLAVMFTVIVVLNRVLMQVWGQ
jgi:hypothetical protein